MQELDAAGRAAADSWWLGMRPEGWVTIAAVLIGPILALGAQRLLDKYRDSRRRKEAIFHRLMATRATTVSTAHVEALNQIDVEFYGRSPSSKRVTAAWKTLRNHLGDKGDGDVKAWHRRTVDLRVELLWEMGRAVGYRFDKDDIARNVYFPGAQDEIENDLRLIRKGLVSILTHEKTLNVWAGLFPRHPPIAVSLVETVAGAAVQSALPESGPIVKKEAEEVELAVRPSTSARQE